MLNHIGKNIGDLDRDLIGHIQTEAEILDWPHINISFLIALDSGFNPILIIDYIPQLHV